MSAEENKALFRSLIEAENAGNLDAIDAILTEDYVNHDPSLPPELQQGREGYKQVVRGFRTAFPDLHGTIDDIVAAGDKVAARWTFVGTHLGDLQGLPPTGRQAIMQGHHIVRIADGRIAEGWIVFDAMGMMQQLGAIPGSGQPTE